MSPEHHTARPLPVPERNAGEDEIGAVVGKQKQGNKKFVFWRQQDGTEYGKDTCTWEPSDIAELDADDLIGKQASFRLGRSTFEGTIKRHDGGTNYWVEFQSSRHKNRSVDLELPRPVVQGEYSWWRLAGYDTNNESTDSESDGTDSELENGSDE